MRDNSNSARLCHARRFGSPVSSSVQDSSAARSRLVCSRWTSEGLGLGSFLPVVAYCCRGDDHWTCLHISDALRSRFRIEPEDWSADPLAWLEWVHPDDRDDLVVERLTALAERRRLCTEYRLRTREGHYRWVRDEAEPHWPDGAEEPLMYGVLSDITRRRHSDVILSELYEASRLQVARLQQQLEERDLFTLLLAHDVRSPLSVAAAALGELDTTGTDAEAMARAKRAVAHARSLVEGIADIGRWQGDGVLRLEETTLAQTAERALSAIETGDREVVVDVPDAPARLDELLVSRALANLVENAIRHTPSRGHVRLRAYLQDKPRSIIFSVEDEGDGIPETIRDDVFRPFVTSRPSYDGTHGLGLNLVQRMAVLHGGRVWFEDLPAGGCAFHLLIPQE